MALFIFIAFLVSMAASALLLPWILRLCHRNGLYDSPNARKVHRSGIPRLGGVVFVPTVAIGLMGGMTLLTNVGFGNSMHISTLGIGVGVLLVYFMGIIDDMFGLSARVKLMVQIVAALSFPACGLYLDSLHGFLGIYALDPWMGCALTVLVAVFVMNAMNMIDGIDGLCACLSIVALVVLSVPLYAIGNYTFCLFTASVVGTLVVFLYYNMIGKAEQGKKTFMGDSGSMFLGFSLSYLALKVCCDNDEKPVPDYGLLLSYSVLLVPAIDLVRVALGRLLRGKGPFTPDKTHIHHRLMEGGIFMRRALLMIVLVDVMFVVLNMGLYALGLNITLIVLVDVALYALWMMWVNRRIGRWRSRMTCYDDLRARYEENVAKAKTICILTPRFPFPENGGDLLRINNISRELRRQGYRLVLVSFEDNDAPQIYEAGKLYDRIYTVHRNCLRSLVMSVLYMLQGMPMQCGYYSSGAFRKKLREVIETEKPDVFVAHLLRMMPYLDELDLHDRSIIEMTDALSRTYALSGKSKGSWLLRNVYNVERLLIRRAEQYSMLRFPKNVLVAQGDIDYLRSISNHSQSLVLHTNGVTLAKERIKEYDTKKIVFVGHMCTLQNQDAVIRFVNDTLPLILRKEPDTMFYIVGADPTRKVQRLAGDNVIVTGYVDDMEAAIGDACLAVAPVRVAAGIQNKVLVAMGCGLPVVMTSLVAGAIPELIHEQNCMIQDEDATLADACVRLMQHADLREDIAGNGYEVVRSHYSWEEKISGYVSSCSR